MKRKHVLRGTRFSLPKPRVSCVAAAEVLSSHVFGCAKSASRCPSPGWVTVAVSGMAGSLVVCDEDCRRWLAFAVAFVQMHSSLSGAGQQLAHPTPHIATINWSPPFPHRPHTFTVPTQGGRYNDLILREDQLLAKAHRLRAKKKDKAELDPFAPEYGEDTWHKVGSWRGGACRYGRHEVGGEGGVCREGRHKVGSWRGGRDGRP